MPFSKKFGAVADAIPIYVKIYHEIKEQIIAHHFLPAEKLPSENELRKQYGVSRQTIQNTFQLLVEEGLVIRRQGKASYVTPLTDSGEAAITLHLGGINTPQVMLTQFHGDFARRVLELTTGTVRVIVHHSSELGDGARQVRQTASGKLDMFGAAVEWLELLDPLWSISSFPFLFKNIQHLKTFVNSPFNDALKTSLRTGHGVRVLADNWYRPSRVLLSKTPCFRLEDLKGKRMAVPPIPLYKKTWELLGTIPTLSRWGDEKKDFLQEKIDMMDAPLDSLLELGLHTVAPYITLTNHLFSRACIIINEKKFHSLRSDVQQALVQAAQETGEQFCKYISRQSAQDRLKAVSEGAFIIEADMSNFRSALEKHILSSKLITKSSAELYNTVKKLAP